MSSVLWPRWRHPDPPTPRPARRGRAHLVAAVALVVLGTGLLAGCSQQTREAMHKREVVVHFVPGTSPAAKRQVRAACAHASSAATPEPIPTSTLRSVQVYGIRFRVDHASDGQLTELYTCLTRHSSVAGVALPNDDGGM